MSGVCSGKSRNLRVNKENSAPDYGVTGLLNLKLVGWPYQEVPGGPEDPSCHRASSEGHRTQRHCPVTSLPLSPLQQCSRDFLLFCTGGVGMTHSSEGQTDSCSLGAWGGGKGNQEEKAKVGWTLTAVLRLRGEVQGNREDRGQR